MSKWELPNNFLIRTTLYLTACTSFWAGNRIHAIPISISEFLSGYFRATFFSCSLTHPVPHMAKVILLKKRRAMKFILQPQNEKLGPRSDLYYFSGTDWSPGVKTRDI